MGYHLNSIYSISSDDKHSFFIFMLGGMHGLVNSTQEWLDKNFNAIATALGPNAVIVRGLSSNFEKEVIDTYHEQIRTKVVDFDVDGFSIDNLLSGFYRKYHVRIETPILLITDRNPNEDNNEKQIFYLIPVGGLEELDVQNVIEIMLDCVRINDFQRLDEWILYKFGNGPLNALKKFNEIVELNPGIAGISLNLNAIIERFLYKRDPSQSLRKAR